MGLQSLTAVAYPLYV